MYYNKTMKAQNPLRPHLIILAVIVLLFAVGVVILLRWNKGTPSDYDPADVSDEFDIEALDFIVPPDPAYRAKLEEGEGLHILCIGNNPFSDETGDSGLAALIADATGGSTYNGAFPGSTVATKTNPGLPHEFFSLFYVTMALINRDASFLVEKAALFGDERHVAAAATLAALDMEEIDVLLIMYDTTDYNILSPADNPNDGHDLNAYTGSLRTAIENFQTFFPHLRIILMSHSYARYLDADGSLKNGTIHDLGNGNLPHYLVLAHEVAFGAAVTFIDNYFGTINEENYPQYMRDHMHYNEDGRALLARRAARVILGE